MCIEEPSSSSTKPSPSSSPSSSRPHPINPNHVQLSHTSVLTAGGIRGSWSIEKPKKASVSSQEALRGKKVSSTPLFVSHLYWTYLCNTYAWCRAYDTAVITHLSLLSSSSSVLLLPLWNSKYWTVASIGLSLVKLELIMWFMVFRWSLLQEPVKVCVNRGTAWREWISLSWPRGEGKSNCEKGTYSFSELSN